MQYVSFAIVSLRKRGYLQHSIADDSGLLRQKFIHEVTLLYSFFKNRS